MTVTKSQKIAFGLLATGLVALGYDRLGTAAPADETAAVADDAPATAGTPAGTAAPAAVKSLPELLRGLVAGDADMEAVADPFAAPASWFPVAAPTTAPVAPDERRTQFLAAHVLRAVVRSGRAGQAVVDGRLVRVGQSVDGWRLVAVSPQHATFADGPRRAVLALPDAPADVRPPRPALPGSTFSLTD